MKNIIETKQGANVYPALQQILIHQGKVLKDTTTLEENNVAEDSFIVIMLSKVHQLVECANEFFFYMFISKRDKQIC